VTTDNMMQPSSRAIGRVLILLGVAVWVPYAVMLITGHEPNIKVFLPIHLAGVIPGAILTRYVWLRTKLAAVRNPPSS
jgi:hypothetical protein